MLREAEKPVLNKTLFLGVVAEEGFSTNYPAFQPKTGTKEEPSCYKIILFISALQTPLVK